jgi:hypothetical protein
LTVDISQNFEALLSLIENISQAETELWLTLWHSKAVLDNAQLTTLNRLMKRIQSQAYDLLKCG